MNLLPSSRWCYQPDTRPSLNDYATTITDIDLPRRSDIEDQLKHAQRRLWASKKTGLVLIFQGLDASGKDGCIRAVCAGMDPMGYDAVGFGVPSELEKSHDFLWRVQEHLPACGFITLMNRSYYEAVLAERALAEEQGQSEGFDFGRRCRSIRDFESHLAQHGTRVLKFWLHVGKAEQADRLRTRLTDPERHWKFHPSDLQTWEHRQRYLGYASEALEQTHCAESPWYVIAADDKKVARKLVCQRVIEVMQIIAGDYPTEDAETLNRYLSELGDGGQ